MDANNRPDPITHQPQAAIIDSNAWMSTPNRVPDCPTGLEYLATLDHLVVKQQVELLEAFTGFETKNKFLIKNSLGQNIYLAAEESDCCSRIFCGKARPLVMKVMDSQQNEVIHVVRPFACCLQMMEVLAVGNVIGRIEQECTFCSPSFAIKDENGETVMRIEGPWLMCPFFNVDFKIVSVDGGQEIGKISKQWSGFAREIFTDADFFGISFPLDLNTRMKAVLLGACLLIDLMYFEK